MQTPKHRKQLILEGRYQELEAPENIGFGRFLSGAARFQPVEPAHPAVKQAVKQVRAVFGREPGEDG